MGQGVGLCQIMDVGRFAGQAMHPTIVGIRAGVKFHVLVPPIALLGLVHLGVVRTVLFLGRDRCCSDGGVDGRAVLEQRSLGGQTGTDCK